MTTPTPPVSATDFISKYRKAAGMVLLTVLLALTGYATDGITPVEWILIVGVGLNAVNVAVVPNLDEGIASAAKTFITFTLAVFTAFTVTIVGGLTTTEILEAITAGLAAIGVSTVPNQWPPATLRRTSIPARPETGYPGV